MAKMKTKSSIHYLGSCPSAREVTFAINAQRYIYTLREPTLIDTVEHLAKRISLGKALAFAKSRAIATEKHNGT
jgi:hypothetical protein